MKSFKPPMSKVKQTQTKREDVQVTSFQTSNE